MASTVVAAETILEAEQRGLEHLVCSVDTLITTNAYSYGTDPRGVWLQYDRVRARTRPKRDDFVLVRGLLTGRSWLRGTGSHFGEPSHPLVGFMERWPIPAAELPPQNIRLAMASLRQAGDESEHPVQRNQALWNALEFYAANTECEAEKAGRVGGVRRGEAAANLGSALGRQYTTTDEEDRHSSRERWRGPH